MGKKNRDKKDKMETAILTKKEREERVENLRELFRAKNAWDPNTYEALKIFNDVCNKYVEDGKTISGKILFPEINKNIIYMINSKKHHNSILHLLQIE